MIAGTPCKLYRVLEHGWRLFFPGAGFGDAIDMTPFGEKVRALRRQRGMSLKALAAALGVSAAYLSALEHGRRGRPSWWLVQRIIAEFNIIWDEAEELAELARLSHPKPVIDTTGLSPRATLLANLLAERIRTLDEERIERMLAILQENDAAGDR